MKCRNLIGAALCGWMLAVLSSCDDDNIVIEPEPTQAEVNIQKLESFSQPIEYYRIVSNAMGLEGILGVGYNIEYPYIVFWWVDSAYRFNMNELIAFEYDQIDKILTLYFH